MSARTAPVKVKPHRAVPAKPPKPPGKITLALRRRRNHAARAALPYAGTVAVSLAADLALHQPGLLWAGAGAAGAVAVKNLHEAHGWHRSGGRAAARKRRKYQGTATRREIRAALSPRAAVRKAAVTCPDLHPAYAPVVIGRACKPGRLIAGSREDSYLVVAPPRSFKTALVSCWAADAPGALLATSSRTDLYAHTARAREALGPVWVLNPDGDGGIPTTLAWSPVDGCADPAVAMQRAGYLMDAAPKDSSGKDAWWDHQSKTLLQYLLHAAALIPGATMWDVRNWAAGVMGDPAPLRALAGSAAAPGWSGELAAMAERIGIDDQYGGAVCSGVMTALSWLSDPVMARAACTAPGGGFDARAFAAGCGTVYLIGADRPHGSLAPYFAALAAEVFEQAKQAAAADGGRLAVPMTFALDEAATICPVPLHKWTSVAAGYGVTVIAAVQALSQLTARWGEHDGDSIFTNMTVKIIGGGFTRHGELERLSAVCGETDTWHHVKSPDGGRTRQPAVQRLYPPERLRLLPPWHALVLHRSTRPVEAVITPVWDRRGYEPATAPAAGARLPAIEPPAAPAPGAIPALAPGTGAPDPEPEPALAGSE